MRYRRWGKRRVGALVAKAIFTDETYNPHLLLLAGDHFRTRSSQPSIFYVRWTLRAAPFLMKASKYCDVSRLEGWKDFVAPWFHQNQRWNEWPVLLNGLHKTNARLDSSNNIGGVGSVWLCQINAVLVESLSSGFNRKVSESCCCILNWWSLTIQEFVHHCWQN